MSQANPRVFVTQENSQLNYGDAEAFGEVVFLTRDDVSPIPGSLTNAALTAELAKKLGDFDFEYDFLAPSGSPTVCGLAFFELGRKVGLIEENEYTALKPPKFLRVLRWSNRDRCYQPVTINLQDQ